MELNVKESKVEFPDTSNLVLDQLRKFLKKIPKRGLNNLTRERHWTLDGKNYTIPGNPTLPRRMEKIVGFGMLSYPYLPIQMIALASPEIREEACDLLKKIFEALDNLEDGLLEVTTVSSDEIMRYRKGISRVKRYLRTHPGPALGFVQKTEAWAV